jgi:hypothetical protein
MEDNKPRVHNIKGRLVAFIGSIPNLHYGCFECKHLGKFYQTCPAYPRGIPEKLLIGKIMHKRVLPDQEGETVFEFVGDQEVFERMERIKMIYILEKLIKKYENSDKLITSGKFDVEEILGMRKGLLFAIIEICKEFGIDTR